MLINTEKTRKLPVEMTPMETVNKAQALAKVLSDIRYAESAMKASGESYKADIKGLKSKADDIADDVRNGTEKREVDIYAIENLQRRTVEIRRRDTNEVVEAIPMSQAEYDEARQGKLELLNDHRADLAV